MTVIVTMAGAGSRFSRLGFNKPKHMIEARGKTLFEWSMSSLWAFRDQPVVLACLAQHDQPWILNTAADMGFRELRIAPRAALSQGQAQTAYDVLQHCAADEPLWIYNIDTYIEHGLHPDDMNGHQGCVHVFESNNPAMSFVRFDGQGRVVEMAEKRAISCWASVGVYGFASAKLFSELYDLGYLHQGVPEVRGERYVAPLYELLIQSGRSICGPHLDAAAVHVLGTPEEVRGFDPALVFPTSGATLP